MQKFVMPMAIYALAVAVFAQGTSEFMLAGQVPEIAADLEVSLSDAGLLTTAFAVGMAVGAPTLALVSLRWPRRRALVAFLTAFVVVHALGAVATSFEVLAGTRVVAALANAGFMAVGLSTAIAMVDANAKGCALAILLAGTTAACVVGVPAGALLGDLLEWRSAFWAVALISLPALAAVLRSVPEQIGTPVRPSVRAGLRALRRPRLLVVMLLGALVNGATFCRSRSEAPDRAGALRGE